MKLSSYSNKILELLEILRELDSFHYYYSFLYYTYSETINLITK